MNETSKRPLEELEAELARQDAELERASALFEEAGATGAHFDVPSSFFEELEELCALRPSAPLPIVIGLRA